MVRNEIANTADKIYISQLHTAGSARYPPLPSHTGTALVPACQNKLAENFAIFINRKLAG